MVRFPPTPILRSTAKATVLAWLVLRGALAMAPLLPGALVERPPGFLPQVSLFVMLLAGAVAWIDLTVARERILLGNLGVGRRWVFGFSLLVSGALEITTALVRRGLGLGI
jgi:hypothetical protein